MQIHDKIVDVFLPEYRVKHIFAAKLRLVLFAAFSLIYLYYMHSVLYRVLAPSLIILVCFLFTGVAYINILRGRWLISSVLLEMFCDILSITILLYLTWGLRSPYFTAYVFYVVLVGMLYNHYLAIVVSIFSGIFYSGFLWLIEQRYIVPMVFNYRERYQIPDFETSDRLIITLILLAGAIYTVKIAGTYSQRREHILELKNRELTALNKMSSTVRTVTSLREVIENLLIGVLEGLNLESVIFLQFDSITSTAKIFVPRHTPRLDEIESKIGKKIDGISIPLNSFSDQVMSDIMQHRVIFRKDLRELIREDIGPITYKDCDNIQSILSAHRIVIIPLVTSETVLGTMLGFSGKEYVKEGEVNTMEAFADQSALSIEAATLIEKLRALNKELHTANNVKSEFLAVMSHELRTPLTAIIGFTELIAEGVMGDITPEQKDCLREVLHNAADLLELINSLLDLTKIESGKMRLDIRPFDLASVIKRVTGTITPLVQKKRQKLTYEIPDALPPINGDEKKIQQLILNLVANANKFTPEDGTISIIVKKFNSRLDIQRESWSGRLKSQNQLRDGCYEIIVEDNGIGIRPEHIEQVFDMFHQGDTSSTRNFGGTGVGLALAKKFVELHSGLIWVESEPGHGAKFTILLPTRAELYLTMH